MPVLPPPHARLNTATRQGATQAAEHLPALTRAYGRALRAAGRRAAARLRQTEAVTAAADPKPPNWQPPPPAALIDAAELAADTQKKTAKLHKAMLTASAGEALRPFGIRFDITAPTSQAVLQQFADRIAETIESAIAEQIAQAVQAGYANGDSVAKVSAAIQAATDAISRPRADMLARSDLNGIANSGSLLAASISGAANTKTWVTAGDDLVRETHQEADGQTVEINDTFDVGGEQALYPGDPELSWEESASCRCTLTYGEPLTAAAQLDYGDLWDGHYSSAPAVALANKPLPGDPVSQGSGGSLYLGAPDKGVALTDAVTSGGTMSRMRMTNLETGESEIIDGSPEQIQLVRLPDDVAGEHLAAVRIHLAENGSDGILEDDELRAVILAVQALNATPAISRDDWRDIKGSPDPLLAAAAGGTPWQATLCVAGIPTVDSGIKRLLSVDGGSWLPLPLPLALMDDSPHADMITSSPLCGRIDQIWMAGNVCQASGVFFDASDDPEVAAAGSKAAAIVGEMRRMGISVDLVDTEIELRVWESGEATELDYPNDPTADIEAGPPQDIPLDVEPDGDEAGGWEEPEYIMCFDRWVIAGATIVGVQALTQATITLVASAEVALTAAAAGLAPLEPPAAWFDDPQLKGPTPLTVTDDGRVYGHLAAWGTCHTGKPGACVTAPHSPSGYRYFHRGELKTAEGGRIAVGVLTMNTGHAGLRMSAAATAAHYDDTGTQGAHVRVGEDAYGIWLAGAINPLLAAEDVRVLMAAPPSGDWREVERGEGLDLFAALAVNVQGFPVPRARLVASAAGSELERVALLAAGALLPAFDVAAFDRQLAVLAASADGVAGLAALVEA